MNSDQLERLTVDGLKKFSLAIFQEEIKKVNDDPEIFFEGFDPETKLHPNKEGLSKIIDLYDYLSKYLDQYGHLIDNTILENTRNLCGHVLPLEKSENLESKKID